MCDKNWVKNGINLAVLTLKKLKLSVRHDQKIFQQFSTLGNSTVFQHLAKINAGKESSNVLLINPTGKINPCGILIF